MLSEVTTRDATFSFEGERAALLTDRRGGYFLSGLSTRYRGWFIPTAAGPLKILDTIACEEALAGIALQQNAIIQKYETGTHAFSYHPVYPVLTLTNITKAPCDLFFDVRHTYADTAWDHTYTRALNQDVLFIHYENTDRLPTWTGDIWIAVWGFNRYAETSDWKKMEYQFDNKRRSYPSSRHCFHGARLWGAHLMFAAHASREELIQIISRSKQFDMKHAQMASEPNAEPNRGVYSSLVHITESALFSFLIDSPDRALIAGLPWFFQRWLRDEMISLGALQQLGYVDETAHLLYSWMHYFSEHNTLPNMLPVTSSSTSDGPAWFCHRLAGLLTHCKKTKQYSAVGGEQGYSHMLHQLEQIFLHYQSTRDALGFFHSARGESWMDAPVPGDDRDGALIEIQCLWTRIFSQLFELTQDKRYSVLEVELHALVLSHFYNGIYLADRKGDFVIRPNIFLAYYAYSQLLSQAEWKRCFEYVLPRLMTSWGGLATIDTTNVLYRPHATGEDKSSYHRGDSWFWINAYAAKALNLVDSSSFRNQIAAITQSCLFHHLFGPVMGFAPEIRGAEDNECLGSPAQTWSSATLAELLMDLGPHYPYKDLLKDQGINVNFNDGRNR